MNSSAHIELDEFDEMAFGLSTPQQSGITARKTDDASDPLEFLNSKGPPPLRIPPKTAPAPASSTRIPLDGMFSDEDDDLFPPLQSTTVARPQTASLSFATKSTLEMDSSTESSSVPKFTALDRRKEKITDSADLVQQSPLRPASGSIFDRLLPKASDSPATGLKTNPATSAASLPANTVDNIGRVSPALGRPPVATENQSLGSRAPVKSSLFKNLVAPPWEQKLPEAVVTTPVVPAPAEPLGLITSLPDKAEAERQRRAMLFGGSVPPTMGTAPAAPAVMPVVPPHVPLTVAADNSELANHVLHETKQAEEEDHRRVSSHHNFIRLQTQQAVQIQQSQANEFVKQYLAENKKQLDAHLLRLRNGFSLIPAPVTGGGGDLQESEVSSERRVPVFTLEKKIEILERKLEDRDSQLAQCNTLIIALEDQHRDEIRDQRFRHDEALQRSVQTHHEYIVSLLANHDAVRRQYEEALGNLRDTLSSKSGLDAVRGTVEQSAREFAVWRMELEQKHESQVKEKDGQLHLKEIQIRDLTNIIERQNEKSRSERETLFQRVQEDTARLLKRQNEIEEQAYTIQRDRSELEAERKNLHNLQTKEMQRLEKRLEETLRERQTTLETLTEERASVEEDRRKLTDTIRAAEEKYALEYKKKQLELESFKESVLSERRQLEEKHRSLDREINLIKDERERLERDKADTAIRKAQLEKYNSDLHRRDLELEQTAIRVAKIKRDGELALHEAKFMDEEHKTRVAKFNVFLEQLREKELSLMRQAVMNPEGGDTRQRAQAIQLPNGALTMIPRRPSGGLIANPARDIRSWQGERDYLQMLKDTQWTAKKQP